MQWLRLLLRIFGWLLTPFLAWAASFFGAVAGALIAMRVKDPRAGVAVTAAVGAVAGFLTILAWLGVLRRSRQVREALAIRSDGTPDIVSDAPESPDPAS